MLATPERSALFAQRSHEPSMGQKEGLGFRVSGSGFQGFQTPNKLSNLA